MNQLRKIVDQTFWQLIGKASSSLSTIFILGLLSRYYGQSGTGVFTLSLTYLGVFFLFADLGLNAYILPSLDKFPDYANKLFQSRLVWSLLLVVICDLLILVMPFSSPLLDWSVIIGSLSIVGSGILTSTNLIFQKHLRYQFSIIATSVSSFLVLPLFYFMASAHLPVYFLAFGSLTGWVSCVAIALFLVQKLVYFHLQEFEFSFLFKTLKSSWFISLTLILNVVYFRADSFVLSSFRSYSEVGIYNFAYQFFQTALVLPTFIMNAFYPLMLKTLNTNFNLFKRQILLAGLGLVGLSLLGILATYLLSPLLIPLISGNKDFNGAILSLQILSLSFPGYFLSALGMWILISLSKNKEMFLIYLLGLIVNLVLNLIYIPTYSYIASSWITGVSEYLILSLQLLILLPILIKDRNQA